MISSPSINDSLPSELLFVAFKWLDGNQVFRIRVVCKQWLKIIEKHRSFWQSLVLEREEDLEWNESALDVFDGKSGSTLKEVSLKVKFGRNPKLNQFMKTLLKSKETLLSFSLLVVRPSGRFSEVKNLEQLHEKVLPGCTRMADFRVSMVAWLPRVGLRRKVEVRRSVEDGIYPLQVLWIPSISTLYRSHPDRFQNLSSLYVKESLKQLDWRKILDPIAQSLKHLSITLEDREEVEDEDITSLRFPLLEALELDPSSLEFPSWMVVPSTSKLASRVLLSGLPSSIREMRIDHVTPEWIYMAHRCPTLQVLTIAQKSLQASKYLQSRSEDIRAGVEVDGIRMGPLEKLVIPVQKYTWKHLRKFKSLVEVVVDLADEPEVWEVEI